MLLLLCGVAAIAIDLGYGRLVQAQLQAVSEVSAHAGAMHLDSTPGGMLDAGDIAVAFAAANTAHGASVSLPLSNVQAGIWDHDASTFTPSGDAPLVNAVQVLARIDAIDTWFAGPAFRRDAIAASGRATAAVMPPPVACAVLAATELDAMGSIVTDSYDSTQGPYDALVAGDEGSICGNVNLDVGGNAEINGDVIVGRGGDIVTHGNSVDISGDQRYLGSSFMLPILDPRDAEADNDNGNIGLTSTGRNPWHQGGIRLRSTDQLELTGGVYYFESLRITGQASLLVTGPSEIWVDGDVDVAGGGIVNQGANPHDLTLYCTGDSVSMGGNSDFYGSLIAPDADVDLGGTHDFYGIVIGWTVDLHGNLVVHADTSLMDPLVQIEPWIAIVE